MPFVDFDAARVLLHNVFRLLTTTGTERTDQQDYQNYQKCSHILLRYVSTRGRDSNSEPAVLETAALPVELPPCVVRILIAMLYFQESLQAVQKDRSVPDCAGLIC